MGVIYILIIASLFVAVVFLGVFFMAVKKGQFEDQETPAIRMLFNDSVPKSKSIKTSTKTIIDN